MTVIEENIKTSKRLSKLGVTLVKEIKRDLRVPVDYLGSLMRNCDNLRGDISMIRKLKSR